jgi:hypothetical protein
MGFRNPLSGKPSVWGRYSAGLVCQVGAEVNNPIDFLILFKTPIKSKHIPNEVHLNRVIYSSSMNFC